MKIRIIVESDTLVDAAIVEEWLTKKGYSFKAELARVNGMSVRKKKRTRMTITPSMRDRAAGLLRSYSVPEVSKKTGISKAVLYRIKAGQR